MQIKLGSVIKCKNKKIVSDKGAERHPYVIVDIVGNDIYGAVCTDKRN